MLVYKGPATCSKDQVDTTAGAEFSTTPTLPDDGLGHAHLDVHRLKDACNREPIRRWAPELTRTGATDHEPDAR